MTARLVCLLLLPVCLQAAAPNSRRATAPAALTSDSLVRVNSTNQPFDFLRPWMKRTPYLRRGLGVVLPDHRILVTAEIVANHTYVELERARSAEKCPAEVVTVDYDCNLALLKPADPKFLEGSTPLELDGDAQVGDKAAILQFESNGLIAETPGVLTTITVAPYPLDHLALLTYRLSAPLQNREGSFTIPAVRDGKLLGLLMRYDSRSQTADAVPAPVIKHFLKDAQRAEYPGFPRAGIAFTATRDPQFRRYIGLSRDGVYINEVRRESAAEKAGLRKGDVILSVAGKPLDKDGNYEDPSLGRISFSHLTNTIAHAGDTVEFRILREGKELSVPVKLEPIDRQSTISEAYSFDRQPRYVILGGLVFQELSRPYLQEWGGNWPKEAPQRLVYLDAYQNEMPERRGKIVFLSQVLPGASTIGYDGLEHIVVKKLNGEEIRDLNDLARAATQPKDGFHKIEFDEDPGTIYLDAAEAEQGKAQIMQDYGIPQLQNLN